MTKTKKSVLTTIILTLAVLILSCLCFSFNKNIANAATIEDPSEEVEPYGVYTKISISLGANSVNVWAKAHNDFTLGNSTVTVYVYLYSSSEYQEDCSKMNLEQSGYIHDLNINKTLEISAPINGVQRYWRAKTEYKLDNKDWQSKETKTYLIDASGNIVS